jgi:hypothetical protein
MDKSFWVTVSGVDKVNGKSFSEEELLTSPEDEILLRRNYRMAGYTVLKVVKNEQE